MMLLISVLALRSYFSSSFLSIIYLLNAHAFQSSNIDFAVCIFSEVLVLACRTFNPRLLFGKSRRTGHRTLHLLLSNFPLMLI